MKSPSGLFLTFDNYRKLLALTHKIDFGEKEKLKDELDRATVVEDDEIPHDVVTMNSVVVFKDLQTELESQVTVVYPEDANIGAHKISVFAPIGAALIGLKVGQEIEWSLPNGALRQILVTKVVYQPEAQKASSLKEKL